MKLKKGKSIITLTDPIQIAAFKHSGWVEAPVRASGGNKDDDKGNNEGGTKDDNKGGNQDDNKGGNQDDNKGENQEGGSSGK